MLILIGSREINRKPKHMIFYEGVVSNLPFILGGILRVCGLSVCY